MRDATGGPLYAAFGQRQPRLERRDAALKSMPVENGAQSTSFHRPLFKREYFTCFCISRSLFAEVNKGVKRKPIESAKVRLVM